MGNGARMFFQLRSLLFVVIFFSFFIPLEINHLTGHGGGGQKGRGGGGRRGDGGGRGNNRNNRNSHIRDHHDHDYDHNHNYNRHRRRDRHNHYYIGGWGGYGGSGYGDDWNNYNNGYGYGNDLNQAYLLNYLDTLNSNSDGPLTGSRAARSGGGGDMNENSNGSNFYYRETFSDEKSTKPTNSSELIEKNETSRVKKGVFFDH